MVDSVAVDDEGIDELLNDDGDESVEAEATEDEAVEDEAEEPKVEVKDDRGDLNAALRESREQYRAYKADADARIARMEEAFQKLVGERQQANEPKIPEYNEDPEGYYQGKLQALERELAALREGQQSRAQQDEQTAAQQQLLNRYASSVRTFSQTNTDFNEAYQHFGNTFDKLAELAGYTDPTMRTNIAQLWEGQIARAAIDNGVDPAAAIYGIAKLAGYAMQKQADDDKIVRLQEGQKRARSLSGSKAQKEGQVTLERLAELDGEEFDRAWADLQKRGML